jgi:hypothetical protein
VDIGEQHRVIVVEPEPIVFPEELPDPDRAVPEPAAPEPVPEPVPAAP